MYLQSLLCLGNKFECPICKGKFRTFLPGRKNNMRQNAKCPRCRSLERHRFIWLFLKKELIFFLKELKYYLLLQNIVFLGTLRDLKISSISV